MQVEQSSTSTNTKTIVRFGIWNLRAGATHGVAAHICPRSFIGPKMETGRLQQYLTATGMRCFPKITHTTSSHLPGSISTPEE